MKYLVKLPVEETIEVEIETNETEFDKLIEIATQKAIKEKPKVCWLVNKDEFDNNNKEQFIEKLDD